MAVCEAGLLEGNLRGISEKILPAVQEVDATSPDQLLIRK